MEVRVLCATLLSSENVVGLSEVGFVPTGERAVGNSPVSRTGMLRKVNEEGIWIKIPSRLDLTNRRGQPGNFSCDENVQLAAR